MLKWILCMWVQWKMFRETNLKGFAGKSPFEEALVDSIVDQYKDFTVEVLPCLAVLLGFAEGNLEKLTEEVLLPAREKFFGFMTKFLKESNSGYLVGDSLTFADLYIPHAEKVRSVPALKKWIETRPETKF
ncbi:hypothetical protein Aduo_007187 [Ancylostoma duodenale]